jgi:hypothetical protein
MLNYVKLLPWLAGAVLAGLLFWGYQHKLGKADAAGYARAAAEYQSKELAAQRRQRQVEENARTSRAGELAQVRAEYAARPDAVIRVCLGAPGLPSPAEAGQRLGSGTPSPGSLQAGAGSNTGTDFDPAPLYALAQEADEIVAACRAQQQASF